METGCQRHVTDYLEIWFDEVMIEPRGTSILFLTFPIEIGVFIQASGVTSVLDVVSFKTPNFLYCSANRVVITRWHKFGVSPPILRVSETIWKVCFV